MERGVGVHSDMIVNKTKGRFSHAMIYVGGTVMEATVQGGVYSRVPNRIYVNNPDHLQVLRLKKSLREDEVIKICHYARGLSGSAYSIREALIVGLKNKPEYTLTRGQFCSRLVAQSYACAGVNLCQNIDYCSPADIERSQLFSIVPGMIHKGAVEEIDFATKGSTHATHHKNAVKWVRASKKILLSYDVSVIKDPNGGGDLKISTIGDIFMAVLQNKENKKLDHEIASAMISFGYDLAPFDDEKRNPYRYSFSLFSEVYGRISSQEIRACINNEFERDSGELGIRVDNFVASYGNFIADLSMETFKIEFEINLNMIKKLKNRLDILIEFSNLKNISIPLNDEQFERYQFLEPLIREGEKLLE